MKRPLQWIIAILCALSLAACSGSSQGKVAHKDLHQHFDGYTGTFKLYDLTAKQYITYGDAEPDRRTAPASTFKVLHSLIALQTGVVPDAETVTKWDGTVYPAPAWNRDQTLQSAVADSVIWYFQNVARQVGREREQQYLDKVGYGNRQIGSAVDQFWLDGSLTISVNEQLDFITRLYREELPFDPKAIQTVKRLITVRQDDAVTLAGKTGSAERVEPHVGWYVGYVVSHGKPYSFVTRIEGAGATGTKAREITERILRELDLLP